MHIDIRLPVGLMFGIVGLLLIGCGLLGDATLNASSLGINIDLWWGAAMTVFGGVMLWLSRR